MTIVPRTCTELRYDERRALSRPPDPQPLAAFRQCPAYVLLGDPGMGKSTAFAEEERVHGETALSITARDFATFDADQHPEWKGKALLIDGLDEIRAGETDPRPPIDRIRANLDKLGKPRFRLSCRHADWLDTDGKSLEAVSPSGKVTVLRLDPLDDRRAAELLRGRDDVEDADGFIAEARRRGMEGSLANPQSLAMLAQAAHDGSWPESRTATFEQACRGLASEHNAEHLSVRPGEETDRILDAAGRLCAVLLISGSSGYATTSARADQDYPYVAKCGYSADVCREAIATKLFQYREQGRVQPVHRHIAEYVAARHMASLIERGLPAGRAVALMSAPDGKIASELRGLSAWLAAHSTLARHDLIARDPIGLALYGDVQAFSADEQQALFSSLVHEPRSLEPTRERARAFAALATPAMRDVFTGVLTAPPDDGDGQLVVDFVLRLLREGPPLAGLSPLFLDIARDRKRWPRVRHAALGAFIYYDSQAEHDTDLVALLRDIRAQRVDDPDDQLLGRLLSTLYPRLIPPTSVWDYINDTNEIIGGTYMQFWVADLPDSSPDQEIADLLDECHTRLVELEAVSSSTLERCVARLLARALQTQGDSVDANRLYGWLNAAIRLGVGQYESRNEAAAIRNWMAERPVRHLEIMLEGIRRYPAEVWYAPYEAFQRLFGAEVSPSFFESCVRAAQSMAASTPAAAESLLRFAVQAGRVDPQTARDLIGTNVALTRFLESLLEPVPAPPDLVRHEEAEQARHAEMRRKAQRSIERLKANEAALQENRAPVAVLHQLARTYFGSFVAFTPERGTERLKKLVHPDGDLLDAAIIGLRHAIERDDLPDADTILTLQRQSRLHYLCWPFLAGLAEAGSTGSLCPAWWTEDRMRTALAAYFGCAHADYEPPWYSSLIEEHPATVAAFLLQFAGGLLRDGSDSAKANLWHLAFDRRHAKVARHVSIPLLRAFPPRAKKQLLPTLDYLLLAAFQHADSTAFRQLIDRKLSRKSLPASQRGRWLAAGCALAPAAYERAVMEYVGSGRQEERTLHLASFFCPQERTVFVETGNTHLAVLLTRVFGRMVGPDELGEGLVTPAMDASTLVGHCIRVLAGNPDPDATEALVALRGDAQLSRWHRSLSLAADNQQVNRRDHEYHHPTIEQVGETLDGGTPAGPADLAALALDRLKFIAARTHSTNTDDWKQHWNEDQYGRPTAPKREESCTRALLSDLRQLLPTGVDAEPETRHSNDTRADFSVSYGGAHVPVEVKRSNNSDLWRAVRTQLISKYTIDSATGGHGIYLVLWFGRDLTQRSPAGERPATPGELREQLEATLTDAERRRISMCVIDVSRHPD